MYWEYPKIETALERNKDTFKIPSVDWKYNNPIFEMVPNAWEWTEKIDGTNISIEIDEDHDLPRGPEIHGRTLNAEIPKSVRNYIFERLDDQKCRELFQGKHVTIFGEGYGGKIQAGKYDKDRGGKYSETEKFIVFDILVNFKYWLKRLDIIDICTQLNLEYVPYIGRFPIGEAFQKVHYGFESILTPGTGIKAEGLIGRTEIPLFDANHKRLICKLKTRDF